MALFFGVALYVRIVLPYNNVFSGGFVKFNGTDAYYYMRIVDNLIHNFPTLNKFDPYLLYPNGMQLITTPFFSYLLAGTSWIIGFGSPSAHTVQVVCAYLPAILGGLTIIPVYFVGRTLFNKWAGIIGAGLIAFFGGDFLSRSTLGATDQHVAETLISTTAIMFLIMAIKSLNGASIKFGDLKSKKSIKPLIYCSLTGIFLGLYIITWQGALMFVFIFLAYFVVQFFVDYFKGKSVNYLCIAAVISFVLATIIYLVSMQSSNLVTYSMVLAILIPVALTILSWLLKKYKLKSFLYPTIAIGGGLLAFFAFYLVSPTILTSITGSLNIFVWQIGSTISEMQPFLFPNNQFTFSLAWLEFTTSFFISLIAIGIIIYSLVKRDDNGKMLLVVWSLITLAATLAQRRFAYYYAGNIAILTGYCSWLIIKYIDFRKKSKVPIQTKKRGKRSKQAKPASKNKGYSGNALGYTLSVLIIFFGIFFPNISSTVEVTTKEYYGPSIAWCETLTWMKNNTPDPFGNPNFYYALYQDPKPGQSYTYPASAYAVTSLWDYGYWITEIANRIPTSNPATGFRGESSLFLAQDETTANSLMDKWNSKYLLVDYKIANINIDLSAIAEDIGGKLEDYGDVYYNSSGGTLSPVILYYPKYYQSLVVRLYNFDGAQIFASKPMVVNYEIKQLPNGTPYNSIISLQTFDTYEKAANFVASQKTGLYKLVSDDQFSSPIPEEKLSHYDLIYSSHETINYSTEGNVSEVKVFDYKR